jgi:hypothetical protein
MKKIAGLLMAAIFVLSGCNDTPKPSSSNFPHDIKVIGQFDTGEVTIQRFYDRTYNVVCYIRTSNSSMCCVAINPALIVTSNP